VHKQNKSDEEKLIWMAALLGIAILWDIKLKQWRKDIPKRAVKMLRKARVVVATEEIFGHDGQDCIEEDGDEEGDEEGGDEESDKEDT
jgi:hypothetical protein